MSYFYMETLSGDINLLKGISPSDVKMKALKPVSSCNLRLGNPPEFQPPLSLSSLWRWVIFPVTRVDPSLLERGRGREGRLMLWKCFNNGIYPAYFGAKRWMIWKLCTPRICDRPEKHLMNVHRRSTSWHRPLPLASSCYHVPFRHCVLPWKIENCTAVTAEHCSWKCRAAIMSNL